MPLKPAVNGALPYLLLGLFFLVSYAARPLLSVDETRYLTVAWEMYLQKSLFVPTLNFEPYFQKPPLLFWAIDLAWSLVGVSRGAAMAVVYAIACLTLRLTQKLGQALFPDQTGLAERLPWLMLGSVAFIVYSSLVLFDLLLTVTVLAAALELIAFAKGRGLRHAALAGLCIGLGVLAKGPVVLIHLAAPILFYPAWRDETSMLPSRRFLAGVGLAIGVAFLPVIIWLAPAFSETGFDFAYNLVWRQAAGRVAGNLESAHVRPIYFYVLCLPPMLLPWGLAADLWRSRPLARYRDGAGISRQDKRAIRFLAVWIAFVVVVFSLISGKQPHYLMPALPPVILILGVFGSSIRLPVLRLSAAIMLALFAVGQCIAAFTALQRYDLAPMAAFAAERKSADWAFAGRYQGELTFLAGFVKPVTSLESGMVDDWIAAHPGGFVIARRADRFDDKYPLVFGEPKKSRYVVISNGARAASSP